MLPLSSSLAYAMFSREEDYCRYCRENFPTTYVYNMKKSAKEIKEFYGKNYKPNKNAKPITYKGKKYLSKAQCRALENITRKELDEYLNNN